jgi:peptidoglycan-associated lipoprotein
MRTIAAVILLASLAAPLSGAQSRVDLTPYVPRYTVGVGYDFLHANAPPSACNCFGVQGGFVQGAVALNYWLRIAGEITGGRANNISPLGQNLTLMTYAAGPQVVLHTHRVETFGQVLFGAAHASDSYFPSGTTVSPTATSFALTTGGGIDINLTRHIAIRPIEAQYVRTTLPNGVNNVQNQTMLGAGIVLRMHGSWWTPDPHRARAKADKQMHDAPVPQPAAQPVIAAEKPVSPSPAPTSVPIPPASEDYSDFGTKVHSAYFDYDSYVIRPDAKLAVEAAAAYLKSHPKLRIIIGGYADERGTAEYNLALSEKRAQVVRDSLIFNGVSPDQLDVIAYGKEKQVCEAENEACFQENRRAEFEPRR